MSKGRTGWIYVLKNEGLPGHVKVGRTIRDTKLRADELWRDYGTLHPFAVHSKHMVNDCVAVETIAHQLLKWCRVPASEIFECDPLTAQKAIRQATILTLERPWYKRAWHWIVLPRPEARSKPLAKGRGYNARKHNPWPLVLVCVLLLIYWACQLWPEEAYLLESAGTRMLATPNEIYSVGGSL